MRPELKTVEFTVVTTKKLPVKEGFYWVRQMYTQEPWSLVEYKEGEEMLYFADPNKLEQNQYGYILAGMPLLEWIEHGSSEYLSRVLSEF